MKATSTSVPWFFQFLVVYYALHFTIPFVGFYTPAIVNGSVLLFLYAYLFIKNTLSVKDLYSVLPIFTINFLSILYFGFGDFATELYGLLQLMIYPLLSLYLIKSGDKKSLRRMAFIIILSLLLTSVTTIIGNNNFPHASRMIAASLSTDDSALYAFYMSLNIGSFAFVYTLVLIIPYLIFLFRNKCVNRLLVLPSFLIIVVAIFVSEFATAFLFLLITIILLFVFPKSLDKKHFTRMVILAIIVLITSDLFLSPFLNRLSKVVDNEVLSIRLQHLSDFSSNDDEYEMYGDIEARSDLYLKSIDAFRKSPLWGGSRKVGGHSFVFDNMGRFGIIGILGMIIMFKSVYNCFVVPYKKRRWYGHCLFTFIIAILLSVLNPKDNLIVLTFFMPIFFFVLSNDEKR